MKRLFCRTLAFWVVVCVGATFVHAGELSVDYFDEPSSPPVLFASEVNGDPPTLDGKLDDPAWRDAVLIEKLSTTAGGETPTRTMVRVCFDRQNIYIAFDCHEPQMDNVIVSAQAGEDKWPGNCVEVFIDAKQTKQRFWQFITNHLDAHNDYGPGSDMKWNGQWRSKAGITETGWCTEIAIPFTDLGYTKAPVNGTWGLNVTRERIYKGDGIGGKVTELATWAPMGNFSSVSQYGVIFFGTREAYEELVPAISLRAAIDRYRHSTLNPIAQLALQFDSGTAAGSTTQVDLFKEGSDESISSWTITDMQSTRFGVDIPIAGLPVGAYRVRVKATSSAGRSSNTVEDQFTIAEPLDAVRTSGRITIEQTQAASYDVDHWHVRTGVPFAEGALTDPNAVKLMRGSEVISAQTSTLATWSKGGSIKWLGVDFQLPIRADVQEAVQLHFGGDAQTQVEGAIVAKESPDAIEINTGAATFRFRRSGFNGIDAMWLDERQVIAPGEQRGPYMTGEDGVTYWAANDPDSVVTIEEQGPIMTIVRAEGVHRNGDRTLGRYVMRYYFYSGTSYCRVQHTFIITEDTTKQRYSDIAVAWPIGGEAFSFGLPQQSASPARAVGQFAGNLVGNESVSLLQRSWDDFVIKSQGDPQRIHIESDKAPGWIARGETAVLVRDFWQNFPKELEATRDAMIVHVWPDHGEESWAIDEHATPADAWRLLFAHQGDLLDFNVPEAYYNETMLAEYGFGERGGNYGPPAKRSNGMGVSRTHDMLFVFGDAAKPQRIEAINDAFQRGVHFAAAPTYLCSTDVAGPMHPHDPERFPVAEDFYSSGFDYLMDVTLNLNNAYGMFNYGDSFTKIKTYTAQQEPSYYRLWAGYHHGRARVPWLLYMRSGDPKYLKWAMANTRHLSDVDTCHYTTPQFESHPWEDSRKLLGGMCDYKGFVHWHVGHRTGEYNSQMDFLMYGYYLTGDRSLWDTLMIAGPCSVERGRTHPSRHGGGCLSSWVQYYQATWDPRALLAIKSGIDRMYTKPAWEHSPPSISWAPYIEPWIDMTGDPKAIAHLMEFADWCIADANERPEGGEGVGASTRALGLAYRLTGNIAFLQKAAAFINSSPKLFSQPGDSLSGMVDWYPWSYNTQNSLRALEPMATAKDLGDLDDIPYWTTASGPSGHYNLDRTQPSRMMIELPEHNDQAFTFGGRLGSYTDVTYRFVAPSGKVIDEGVIPKPIDDQFRFTLDLPVDGEVGTYRFEAESPRLFRFWYSNVSTLGTQRFVIPTPDDSNDGLGGAGRWYFYVPPDCEHFAIRCRDYRDGRKRTSVDVVTPDDQPYRSISLPLYGEDQWLAVEPPNRFRGQVWSIAMSYGVIVDVEGIAPWFAGTPRGAMPSSNK